MALSSEPEAFTLDGAIPGNVLRNGAVGRVNEAIIDMPDRLRMVLLQHSNDAALNMGEFVLGPTMAFY